MKGTLITSTPRSVIQPLAVQGIPVPTCHAQIVDMVRGQLGEAHVLLFAEPVFDESRAVTDWYTPVQGTPVPLSRLDEQAQNRARSRFAAMAEAVRSCVRPLKDSPDRRRALAGEILELALRYPGEQALYLVGEQPVVTCWGCGPAQAGVEAQDLTRLGPAFTPPSPEPDPEPIPAPQPLMPEAPGCARVVPWLLGLILLLLLAGLLYGWKTGCLRAKLLDWGWLKGPSLSLPAQDPGGTPADRDGLLEEIEALRLQVIDRKNQCPDAAPQEALAVPEDAPDTGDLSFLEGTWMCDTGLADSNNAPVIVIYTFDRHGQGGIVIQSPEHGHCTATARTSLAEGGLRIETEPEITCPGGVSYRGQAIICTGTGGRTICEGRNTPGSTTWRANFYRR